MKILIIGGKRFVGYHIASKALSKGHEVVFFNRGKTNSDLFSNCENIIGDRNKDMEKVKGMKFDFVIDTCAYYPSQVEKSLDALEGCFKKYLLISTLSVVKPNTPYFDESVELFPADYDSVEITAKTYGPLKVACEEVLINRVSDKGIIIRPGYIVGDMDYTHRFTYVPIMMKYMNKVLIPKTSNLHYSFVDGKDLSKFVIHALESNLSGIYHTVGPDDFYYQDYIDLCLKTVNPNCEIKYVDDKWFSDKSLKKAMMFPTCNDNEEGENVFFANTSKAKKAGFTTRPVEDSIRDGLAYFDKTVGNLDDFKVGMNYKDMLNYFEE